MRKLSGSPRGLPQLPFESNGVVYHTIRRTNGNWDWWTSTRDKPGDNVSDISDMFSRRMNQQQSRQSWVASVAQYARVI